MSVLQWPTLRLGIFFLILSVVTCAPIWWADYFINQDGSGHVYSAAVMIELIKGNSFVADVFAFNSFSFPNSSGHWLMAGLLLVGFSPFTVTKIIVTLTFLGVVAGAGWLRWKTVGREGVETALLIGAAIAFNWLWLIGFYNFLIGVVGFAVTLGLFYVWREDMNWRRALVLAALFALVYLSHIVSFGILAGSVCLLSLFVAADKLKKTIGWTIAALLPIAPMLLVYRSVSEAGGGFSPVWRYLSDPYSLSSWLSQFRGADLFILISRKTFPFTGADSIALAIFTPALWLVIAIFAMTAASWFYYRRRADSWRKYWPFALIYVLFIFIVLFAPDDFSWQNGGIMRERFLLCSFLIFVPLFRFGEAVWLKRLAHFCLGLVIVFQTLALWEYSLKSNETAREFLTARAAVPDGSTLAAVTMIEDGTRFHAAPAGQLTNFFGIGRPVLVWDNYEIGHFLFPVVAKNPSDRKFVYDLTRHNFFPLDDASINFDERLANLDAVLAEHSRKIDTLLVWGSEPRIEAVVYKYFESESYFQNGRVRLLRRRDSVRPK